MFKSSLNNLVYFIISYISKKLKVTPWAIIALIFSFIFVLDVLSGIILYSHERNQIPEILERIRKKKAEKIKKKMAAWQAKKHLNIKVYQVASTICTAILCLSVAILLVFLGIERESSVIQLPR